MGQDNGKTDTSNPLGMVPDRYDGKTFVLPPTPCTEERRLFLRRTNEILGFLFVTCLSYQEYRCQLEKLIPGLPLKENTPMKITLKSRTSMMPANRIVVLTKNGVDVLARQIFVMIYGSFETYLYGLFDRSYSAVGISEDFLETSLGILMKKRWDGKFSKMEQVFGIEYRAGRLSDHFSGFTMGFEGKMFKNPLDFLDELTQVRHRIVHASSILDKDRLIYIELDVLPVLAAFFNHLTDYIDEMFTKRFGYLRTIVNPAEA